MKFLTKSFLLIFLGTIFLIIVYGINLFSSKPFSLDHYLTKYLIISLSKSPEYLTYVGAVDFLNPITKHNGKLSNDSIDDIRKNYLDNKKHLNILENFDDILTYSNGAESSAFCKLIFSKTLSTVLVRISYSFSKFDFENVIQKARYIYIYN